LQIAESLAGVAEALPGWKPNAKRLIFTRDVREAARADAEVLLIGVEAAEREIG